MPLNAWYSVGIRIYGKRGSQFATAAELPTNEAKEYINNVKTWLSKLRRLPTGDALVQEIDGSGHICYIMQSDPVKGNMATQYAPNPADKTDMLRRQLAGMAAPITPPKKILIPDKNVMGQAYNDLKNKLANIGAPLHKTDTNSNFIQLISNMSSAGLNNPAQKIANATGKSLFVVTNWMTGNDSPDRTDYFKIVAAFYDYFPRGAGVDTCVQMTPGKDKESPEYIQLGHELIHAWRMMTGRRIVGGNSWEEEAMTVGLSPFANLRFTENRLREEAKLKTRLKYGGMAVASTEWMSTNYKNIVESSPAMFQKR
jgi:hypothetical protein